MIGKEILNYIVTAELGSGGMGSVFLAEHKFIKQQKVAIKVIKGEVFNEFAKNRLKEEAERLASLDHPNIVKFLNYDIDAQGNVYLIMEYAEGVTLDKYISRKTGLIVEEKILPLFEPILDAFDYAHKKKVVHRDIKPSNIIITNEGVPKILDFGISTIMDGSTGGSGQEGVIMGTPSYMSPEQVKGSGIDTRSDIYSLGVMLHQMLTGNAPYDTTTLSEHDINDKVVKEPLPRMKTYYHYVSDKMQAIVDKATAKDPKDRYQTCADFKKALRKALVKEPVSKPVIAVIVVLAVLLVGGGFFLWDYNHTKVRYYKDYVEQWGVPQGIGRLSAGSWKHANRMYRMEYRKFKLQRISHVNSFGSIINDGESERYERPVDMRLYYADNGMINTAKVYNQAGKVLYVKAYNDKLNTVIFQYDDQYGTEMNLGSETVGYVNALSDSQDKGKISRWLIEYDENGYVAQIQYAGFQNVRVCDAQNIYGRSYVRDAKGRTIEEHYLGYDGSPKATKWGLGIKKFYYDDKDNWVRSEYLTVDGEPALDASDGVCVYAMEYDQYGNLVRADNRNSDGTPMLPGMSGLASVSQTFDSRGLITETTYYGLDGEPCFNNDNLCRIEEEYDERGYRNKMVFYDPDGKVSLSKYGYSSATYVNNEYGYVTEQWYYGLNGELTLSSDGYAGVKARYDEVGNMTGFISFGIDGNPCIGTDGTVGYKAEFNDMNQLSKITYLGEDYQPACGYDNIGVMTLEYDIRGNVIKRSFYDPAGENLTLSIEGISGWNSTYDDNGRETERTFFNEKGESSACAKGYAKRVWTYDEAGNETSYRYFNLSGDPVLVDEEAGRLYEYDNRGNILQEMAIGVDGKLASGKLLVRYKYDNNDNEIEFAVYDRNEKPVKNSLNYHRYTNAYNSRNQCIETRYYGTDGKLAVYSDDKYAVEKSDYDNRGNRVELSYYGTDEKPVCCKQGWAKVLSEFDAFGNITRQLYYGTDGQPTDPKVMVPEGIAGYDKWGNINYIAGADGNGNLIYNPLNGCSVTRREYDSRGNLLTQSYYDENDKPMINKLNGYHKEVHEYTNSGEEKQTAYFGINGEAVLCTDGYHKEVYEYDEQGQATSVAYYGTSDNKVDCKYGYQRIEVKYNDSGVATSRKYYNRNNSVIYTEVWNGSSWEEVVDWRQDVRDLDDECPFDLDDDGDMVLVSVRATGSSTCTATMKLNYSKYELSDENVKYYSSVTDEMVNFIKSEYVPKNVRVTGVLNDKTGRELYRVTK